MIHLDNQNWSLAPSGPFWEGVTIKTFRVYSPQNWHAVARSRLYPGWSALSWGLEGFRWGGGGGMSGKGRWPQQNGGGGGVTPRGLTNSVIPALRTTRTQ